MAHPSDTISDFGDQWQDFTQNTGYYASLAALRDTLLPQLISGRLRVQDAEKFLQERDL